MNYLACGRLGRVGVALMLGVALLGGCALLPNRNPVDEQRADIRSMAKRTLDDLYRERPSARGAISAAAGYAVFSSFGMKIMVAGGGSGQGVAVDRRSGKETFMKMVEIQAGLGMGIKDFRLIWVFERKSDLDRFVNSGWEIGGQASATAIARGTGAAFEGAVAISPGVWLYQLTESGLSLELTAKGTKYFKNDSLN